MAKDIFHANVRLALEKEGWTITLDPLHIDLDETYIEIDLAAQGRFIQKRLKTENVKLLIFDPLNNSILEWKK